MCDALRTCSDSDGCLTDFLCMHACDDPACAERCFGASDEATLAASDAMLQSGALCSTACTLGSSWQCARAFSWGGATPGEPVLVTVRLMRPERNTPAVGLRVRACDRLDRGCDPPLVEGVTGADGIATLDVTRHASGPGFAGYFAIDGTLDGAAVFPSGAWTGHRVVRSTIFDAFVLTRDEVGLILRLALGEEVRPDAAQVVVVVRDCQGWPGRGATVESNAGSGRLAYLSGGTMSPDATATDATGTAALLNVEGLPADGRLVTFRALDGAAVVAERVVVLQPGLASFVVLDPPEAL